MKFLSLATSSVMAIAFAGPAIAQAQNNTQAAVDGTNDLVLEEIVVTAQGRTQRLQDVPVSVSVVAGASLAQANLNSLEAVSARLPNVKITPGPLVDQINVRGVGSGQNAGFEQSVGTFVDGVYRSRSRATRAALFDIDRMEVLKGPQTTFFGANAIAGALNIATRKPGANFAYNATALYDVEDGEYNAEAGVDLPASPDLSFRIAGRASGMDGYVKNDLTGSDGPHDRSTQGRVSMVWNPSNAWTTDARFDIGRSRTDDAYPFELLNCPTPAGVTPAPSNVCPRYLAANGGVVDDRLDGHSASPSSFAHYDFYEASMKNSLEVGSGLATSITSYFDHEFVNRINIIPVRIPGTVGGYDPAPTQSDEDFHQFSQELRYTSETGGFFEYMFGGYYSDSKLDSSSFVGFYFLPFGAFNPLGTTNAATPIAGGPGLVEKSRTLSAFASGTIRPADDFRINFGIRYSNVRKEAVHSVVIGSAINGDPATFVPLDATTQAVFAQILGADLGNFAQPRRTDDKLMPSIGVQYDWTSDVMVYATYSQGFKAGGYTGSSLLNSFGPEDVEAYEIGLKGQFLERRLTTNVSLFRSDYSDLQEATLALTPAGTILSLVQNAARSRAQGVELGVAYRASSTFSISADVAYLDSVYTSYPDGACTITAQALSNACVQDLSGKQRPYAPRWSGNVSAEIGRPLPGDMELRVNPVAYFTTGFYEAATADPLLRQKGNVKFDLRLGVGPYDRRWEIAVIGKNLTNEWTAGYRQAVTNSSGSTYAFPDRPRSIALQLSIKG